MVSVSYVHFYLHHVQIFYSLAAHIFRSCSENCDKIKQVAAVQQQRPFNGL